jgi:membrane-bound serine protease (ClpP class)
MSYGNDTGKIYVIPIKGEINKAVTTHIKANIERAENDEDAVAIIFEIDTLGGFIQEAVKIKDYILESNLQTIAFVNKKAESAGVLLTISCDKIVMAKGATIGSAETIPHTEKNLSYWKGELRAVAQMKNRDPELIEAMADKRNEIIDESSGDYIVKKGELLNLTSKEAKDAKLIDGIGSTHKEVLNIASIDYSSIEVIGENFTLKVAQVVSNPYVATFLILIGFLGIIIEIMTPGFGIGGLVGIVGFFTFFFGKNLSGDSSVIIVSVFVLGIILFAIEVGIPGFGIFGVSGIILIITSIILSFNSILVGVYALLVSLILCIVVGVFLFKYGPKNKYLNHIILDEKLSVKNEKINLGYEILLHEVGIAITSLRPAGSVKINNNRYDVITEGDFVKAGEKIQVIKVIGKKIIVKKVDD